MLWLQQDPATVNINMIDSEELELEGEERVVSEFNTESESSKMRSIKSLLPKLLLIVAFFSQ